MPRLARISHNVSAADADTLAVARAVPPAGLDVVSTTPSPVFSPRRAPQRRPDALATDGCETCGLVRSLLLTLMLGSAVASASQATMPWDGAPDPDASSNDTSAQGLKGFLDEEGRLALPRDFSGSLDPTGFEMVLDENGAPRFVAQSAAADPDARWDDRFFLPSGCDGPVNAIAQGPEGVLYLGGSFLSCGGVVANRVVRYDPATEMWSALGSGAGNGVGEGTFDTVFALAVSGSELYVGGSFFEANVGAPILANRIARWDGETWSALGSGEGNGVNNEVRAMAVFDGDLHVGGNFTQANVGEPIIANRIARWNGNVWSPLGGDGIGEGVNNEVRALAVLGGDLYVAGLFDEVRVGAPILANHIARWNGNVWSPVGSGTGNGVNGAVFALEASSDDLYAGGIFTEANAGDPIPASRIAHWDGSSWSALGSGMGEGLNTNVLALALSGSDLYAAGLFGQANLGEPILATRVAHWNGSEWSALGSGAGNGVDNTVFALGVSGGDLYVGGVLTEANFGEPITANRIARWDGSAWSALGSDAGQGLNGSVRALAASGNDLYVGGNFTRVGSIAANHVARWDGSAWSALGSLGGNGVSSEVLALAVFDNNLYAGGAFNQANVGAAIAVNNIARWNGSAWSAVGSGVGNGVNNAVVALAASSSDLYAGGVFTHVNLGASFPATRVARWDGSAWSALGSDGGNGLNNTVLALAVSGSDLYVGGIFTQANVGAGINARRVAHWNGSTWAALGSGVGNGVSAAVNAVAVSGSEVYVGGLFTGANCEADFPCSGIPANRVARWDGSDWSALGSGAGNGVSDEVLTLAVSGGNLFVGGLFTQANVGAPIPANFIAHWDGSAWSTLGSGTSSRVNVLILSNPGTLYAGGAFSLAGNKPSRFIGRYDRTEIFRDRFEE